MTRPIDTLAIVIRRVEDRAGGYYQVTLQRHRQGLLGGGPFRRREEIQPVAIYELQRSYNVLVERLLVQAAAGVPVPPPDLQKLVALSEDIARILPDTVRQSLSQAQLRARERRRELQITLQVDRHSQALLAVPWEMIALPLTRDRSEESTDTGFLLLNANTSLVRQVRGVGHHTVPLLTLPLKLLGVAATPNDTHPIAVKPIRDAFLEALEPAARSGAWYEGPDTLGQLQRLLREKNPQVLHMVCHGDQTSTARGVRSDLLFTHRDGYTQRVGAADLVPILTVARDLQLVVLQACHVGAVRVLQPDEITRLDRAQHATESLSLALVRAGVPVVVAFQGLVRQDAAEKFVRACYAALAAGELPEAAVAAGRISARTAGGVVDWSQALIYQGSGWPEQPAWHTRLADGLMQTIIDSGPRRAIRAAVLALALALLAASAVRWAMLPEALPQMSPALRSALICWAGLGVVAPAIVAAATRSPAEHDDLSESVRSETRIARFTGAYLGYVIGGLGWFTAMLALWILGPLILLPLGLLPTFTFAAILASILLSYGAARSQATGAAVIAPVTPGLYVGANLVMVIMGSLALLAMPLVLLIIPLALFNPSAVGFTIALALITFVLRG